MAVSCRRSSTMSLKDGGSYLVVVVSTFPDSLNGDELAEGEVVES